MKPRPSPPPRRPPGARLTHSGPAIHFQGQLAYRMRVSTGATEKSQNVCVWGASETQVRLTDPKCF